MQAPLAEHLHEGRRDAVGARRPDREHPPVTRAPRRGCHVRRQPDAGCEPVQSQPVELWLTKGVVEQHPGAGHGDPGAVAARHGDGAGRAVGVDDRDVRRARTRREPGQAVPVDGQQQLVPRDVEVVRDVVHRPPVGQHGPLDLDDVGPVPVAAPTHLAEHDREHRPPDRRRRVDGEVPVTDGAPHGRTHQRRVLREVTVGDQPTVGRHLGDHRPADLPGRQHRRAVVAHEVEHVGEQVVGAHVAGLERGAVLPGDDRERLGVAPEERMRREAEVAGGRGPDGVALAAGPGRRGHDLRPGHRAQLLDGELTRRRRRRGSRPSRVRRTG